MNKGNPVKYDGADATGSRFRLTPLSIIAMFLSLSEAVAGITATQASGGLQIALGIFVIAFPSGVACAFFMVLWHRPYVFYPPREYGEKTSVKQYVEAMRHRSTKEANVLDRLDDKIMQVLKSEDTMLALSELGRGSKQSTSAGAGDAEEIFGGIAARAAQAIRDSFFIIEAGAEFRHRAGRYSIAYQPEDPVWRVGNEVYWLLEPMVAPFTLGSEWALEDAETGQRMRNFESEWSRGETVLNDMRQMQDVGVRPGMVLRAVFL